MIGIFFILIQIADAAENITIKNEGGLLKKVYGPGESMVLRGYLFQATVNSTNGTATVYSPLANVSALNITIYNASNGVNVSNFTLNTSETGLYYSRNDYETGGRLINAPGVVGYYFLLTPTRLIAHLAKAAAFHRYKHVFFYYCYARE